jgi:hypothetical protein
MYKSIMAKTKQRQSTATNTKEASTSNELDANGLPAVGFEISYDDARRTVTRLGPKAQMGVAVLETMGFGDKAKEIVAYASTALASEGARFFARDAALCAAEHLKDTLNKLASHNLAALPSIAWYAAQQHFGVTPEVTSKALVHVDQPDGRIKLFISVGVDAAVVLTEPIILFTIAFKEHNARRQAVKEEMADFTLAYRQSPAAIHENKLLDTESTRATAHFLEVAGPLGSSIASGTTQAVLRHAKMLNVAEKIDTTEKRLLEGVTDTNIRTEISAEANALRQQPRLQTNDLIRNTLGGEESRFHDVKLYRDQKINMTTLGMAAGVLVGNQISTMLTPNIAPDAVIAYDLVQYLCQQIENGDVENGTINIKRFKNRHKMNDTQHVFHALHTSKDEVTVAEFIEEIFHQHVHDQGHTISNRYEEKLEDASQKLADAITGKDYDVITGASLHPQALLALVGEGNIVAHDGLAVANERSVNQQIDEARQIMPLETVLASKEYLSDLAISPEEFKASLKGMTPDVQDFIAFITPAELLTDTLGLPLSTVKEQKIRAKDNDLMENITTALETITAKNDQELRADDVSDKQIKLLRTMATHAKEDHEEKIFQALRDKSPDGLGFAILSVSSYMDELAKGAPLSLKEEKEQITQAEEETAVTDKNVLEKLYDAAGKLVTSLPQKETGAPEIESTPDRDSPDHAVKEKSHKGMLQENIAQIASVNRN